MAFWLNAAKWIKFPKALCFSWEQYERKMEMLKNKRSNLVIWPEMIFIIPTSKDIVLKMFFAVEKAINSRLQF